jgi:hypothetical protein
MPVFGEKSMLRRGAVLFVFLLCAAPTVLLAQADCPTLVAAALDTAQTACETTRRNQACYGNVLIDATAREDAADFTFEAAGDTAEVAAIDTLRLSSFNLDDEAWGVALMQVQANLPDDVLENVTFLLFGNVDISNAAEVPVELPLNVVKGVNVRLRPGEGAVIGSVKSGDSITTTGQFTNKAGERWLRIQFADHKDGTGWVIDWSVEGDFSTLPVVEAGAPSFGPMQAFLFQSGVDDRPCQEAPDSGILIQTPEGVGEISLLVNEVNIQLGSTAYLQAQPNGVLSVAVVEGQARVTAFGVTQLVPAGSQVLIPLDAAGVASAAPPRPVPYNFASLSSLPISLLTRQIDIAPALTQAQIDELTAPDTPTGPPPGESSSAPSSPGG